MDFSTLIASFISLIKTDSSLGFSSSAAAAALPLASLPLAGGFFPVSAA